MFHRSSFRLPRQHRGDVSPAPGAGDEVGGEPQREQAAGGPAAP